MKRYFLTTIFSILIPHLLCAEETADDIDNTVAAGIVFKLAYVMGAHGTWSDHEHNTPETFSHGIEIISRDLSLFSDSERGQDLKIRGAALISFLVRGVTTTLEVGDPEGKKFLEEVGLDPNSIDPSSLAEIFTERIATYAELSETPAWVYDSTQREPRHVAKPSK